jgi:hypothetical protein
MRGTTCICGATAHCYGSDHTDAEGPWVVECPACGIAGDLWAYRHEAWASFRATCRATVEKNGRISQQAASQNASTRIGSAA